MNTIKIARGDLALKPEGLSYGELFLDVTTSGGPSVYIGNESGGVATLYTDSYIQSSVRVENITLNSIGADGLDLYDNTIHVLDDVTTDFIINGVIPHPDIRTPTELSKNLLNSVGLLQIKIKSGLSSSIDIGLPKDQGARWASEVTPILLSGYTYQITFVCGVFYCSEGLLIN